MQLLCHDVAIEPVLQPLSGHFATANVEDEARLDISSQGFWGNHHQKAFFDVKVFNAIAPSYCDAAVNFPLFIKGLSVKNSVSMSSVLGMLTFISLLFSTFGGMGGAATTTFKMLASLLATKRIRVTVVLCPG